MHPNIENQFHFEGHTYFPVPKAPGYYVNDRGLILCSRVKNDGQVIARPLKIQIEKKTGISKVQAKINGRMTKLTVNRVVATIFLPNPNCYERIHHKNGIPTDNRVENLEWGKRPAKVKRGPTKVLHGNSKLSDPKKRRLIYLRRLGVTYRELGRIFKISRQACLNIYRDTPDGGRSN